MPGRLAGRQEMPSSICTPGGFSSAALGRLVLVGQALQLAVILEATETHGGVQRNRSAGGGKKVHAGQPPWSLLPSGELLTRGGGRIWNKYGQAPQQLHTEDRQARRHTMHGTLARPRPRLPHQTARSQRTCPAGAARPPPPPPHPASAHRRPRGQGPGSCVRACEERWPSQRPAGWLPPPPGAQRRVPHWQRGGRLGPASLRMRPRGATAWGGRVVHGVRVQDGSAGASGCWHRCSRPKVCTCGQCGHKKSQHTALKHQLRFHTRHCPHLAWQVGAALGAGSPAGCWRLGHARRPCRHAGLGLGTHHSRGSGGQQRRGSRRCSSGRCGSSRCCWRRRHRGDAVALEAHRAGEAHGAGPHGLQRARGERQQRRGGHGDGRAQDAAGFTGKCGREGGGCEALKLKLHAIGLSLARRSGTSTGARFERSWQLVMSAC